MSTRMQSSSKTPSRVRPWLLLSLVPVYGIVVISLTPVEGRFLFPVILVFALSIVLSVEAITNTMTSAKRWLIAVHLLFPLGLSIAVPHAASAGRLWAVHIVFQGFFALGFKGGIPLAAMNIALGVAVEAAFSDRVDVAARAVGAGEVVAFNSLLIFAFRHRQLYVDSEHLLDEARKNTTMLARANIQLREHTAQAQNVAVLQDRNRLARDIHDTVGHALTSVIVQLGAALELVEEDPNDTARRLGQARETAREGMQQIRASVRSLTGPSVHEPTGRVYWSRAIQTFRETTDIRVVESIEDDFENVPPAVNDVVFRVIQEGLTNAVRHGQADAVEVEVRREGRWLLVRISDNGIGATSFEAGHGLRGLTERVETLEGEVEWRSIPGTGFDLGVDLPLQNDGKRDGGRR